MSVERRRELDAQAFRFVDIKPKAKLKDFIESLPLRETRFRHEVLARKKAILILRDYYGLSFPAIGKILGYADHTSALHHYQRLKELCVKM